MAKLPPEKYNANWLNYLKAVLPGVLLAVLFAYLAWRLDKITPVQLPFNYVLYAIIFGILLKNLVRIPTFFDEGLRFGSKIFLYVGVIFLGGTMNLMDIALTGVNSLVLVVFTIIVVIVASTFIGRMWGMDDQSSHMVGTGIGVCGVSAIMALAPVIKAREKQIFTAIAAALLTDLFVLFTLPTMVHLSNISETFAGYWAGSVASNTAQSVATGFAVSDTAGQIATITKTARNALMAVVVLFFAYYYTRKGLPVGEKVSLRLLWVKFPKFVLGFLFLSLLTTLGLFGNETLTFFNNSSRWMFAICFVGIGAEVDFKDINRKDLKPIALGFVITIVLALVAAAGIWLILLVS